MGRRDSNRRRLHWPRGKKCFARDMREVFGDWSFRQVADWAVEQGTTTGEIAASSEQPLVPCPTANSIQCPGERLDHMSTDVLQEGAIPISFPSHPVHSSQQSVEVPPMAHSLVPDLFEIYSGGSDLALPPHLRGQEFITYAPRPSTTSQQQIFGRGPCFRFLHYVCIIWLVLTAS